MGEKQAYSVSEFLAAFSVDKHLFYEEVRRGRLRTYMMGRKRMVSRAAAIEWQSKMEQTPATIRARPGVAA